MRVAGLIGLCLFLLYGVYEPAFHGLPIDPDRSIAIYYMVVSALAPWYFATKVPVGPMQIFAVHTTFGDHAFRWLVFSLASAAIWATILWFLDRLRRRGVWGRPTTMASLGLGLSPMLDAAYIVGLAVIHDTAGVVGPWEWLTRLTGWPGRRLVELIAGPSWLPVLPNPIPLAEYLVHWGLYLLLNLFAWTVGIGAARASSARLRSLRRSPRSS